MGKKIGSISSQFFSYIVGQRMAGGQLQMAAAADGGWILTHAIPAWVKEVAESLAALGLNIGIRACEHGYKYLLDMDVEKSRFVITRPANRPLDDDGTWSYELQVDKGFRTSSLEELVRNIVVQLAELRRFDNERIQEAVRLLG